MGKTKAIASVSSSSFLDIVWREHSIQIESAWVGPDNREGPIMVFLHEGLGSLSMWRDFPHRLCLALGIKGFVFSRPGYGRSTLGEDDERWDTDYLHQQACEVLPSVLEAARIDPRNTPVWLFGHSDGGSIALIYAAKFPTNAAGLVVVAPHIMVEPLTLLGIEKSRLAYQTTDLAIQLGKYHLNPDVAFWRWNNAWLEPAFRSWSIKALLSDIRCPVLAVQGEQDQYGSMRQIYGVQQAWSETELLELPGCGHIPHRDQPDQLIGSAVSFFKLHNQIGDSRCQPQNS